VKNLSDSSSNWVLHQEVCMSTRTRKPQWI
jgi:hypothetical protein